MEGSMGTVNDKFHMYVWRGKGEWIGMALARSVDEARSVVLEDGEGDASTPIRSAACETIRTTMPEMFHRANGELVLTDSAELVEADAYLKTIQDKLKNAEAALTAAEQRAKELEEALRIVEWIMVGGRVQCPDCLSAQVEGHAVLCRIDEALRPTPEKARIRAEQEAMYKDCQKRAALAQPRTGSQTE
jgi:hypothetical protein